MARFFVKENTEYEQWVFSVLIYHLSCGMLHLLKWNIICLCIELYLGWLLNENYYSIIAIRNGSTAYGCVQSIKWLMEPKTLQRPLQIHSMARSPRFYTLISALEATGIRLCRTTINQALYTVCASTDEEYSKLQLISQVLNLFLLFLR